MTKKVLSASEAKARLSHTGESTRAWARRNGLTHTVVRSVLEGKCPGRIGQGHKAAVLLGMKAGVILDMKGGSGET